MNACAPLKAYVVQEHDERTGFVYFARSDIEARKSGAQELADGELSGVTCHRAKWADVFAEHGRLPARELIARGWWWECYGCDNLITEDWLRENHKSIKNVIGSQRGAVFCSGKCFNRHARMLRKRDEQKAAAIECLSQIIKKRFPDAQIVHDIKNWQPYASVWHEDRWWILTEAAVSFTFPGGQYPASLKLDRHKTGRFDNPQGPVKPRYWCSQTDQSAFEEWAREQKRIAG